MRIVSSCAAIVAAVAAFLGSAGAFAAERNLSAGNETAKTAAGAVLSDIYQRAGEWAFLLTRENLGGVADAHGAEVTAGYIDGAPVRIMLTAWTPAGKYAAEYYFTNGALLHVYETHEFFEDAAPGDAWRNFKGAAAWERRVWFAEERFAYGESTGTGAPAPDASAARLVEIGEALARRFKKAA